MILEVISQADSTIISNINSLAKSIEVLQKKVIIAPLIPVLTAILGGVLVWIGQYFDRKAKRKVENIKEIISVFTTSELLLFTLKGLAKQMAGEKNLRMFWHYSYLKESAQDEPDSEIIKKDYETSLLYADAATKSRSKINETLAQYYSNISKFNQLSKKNINIDPLINLFKDAEFDEADEIDININERDAHLIFHNNNTSLNLKYLSILSPLDKLNTEMSNYCKTLK